MNTSGEYIQKLISFRFYNAKYNDHNLSTELQIFLISGIKPNDFRSLRIQKLKTLDMALSKRQFAKRLKICWNALTFSINYNLTQCIFNPYLHTNTSVGNREKLHPPKIDQL